MSANQSGDSILMEERPLEVDDSSPSIIINSLDDRGGLFFPMG